MKIILSSTLFLLFTGISVLNAQQPWYQSETYSLFADSVTQGDHVARVEGRQKITSNYKSPASTRYSSTITFKFAINGKDNEAQPGQDHRVTVIPENGSDTSPVITFGAKDPDHFVVDTAEKFLPPNTEFTVRVDLNHVLDDFEEKGYYTTYDGEKIPASQFKGVYIAGGSEPLSWDFDNLHHHPEYKLSDDDGDGIYTATFTLNPHDPNEKTVKSWELKNDISRYPTYHSGMPLIDALYNMGLDETGMLIEADSTFRTGAKWPGVWTRDISYSVLLAYAYLEPEISRISLMKKVKRGRIIQDTGSGGAWPVSSDRVVWSLAAWELYTVTGNRGWLEKAYRIIKNSIEDDLKTTFAKEYGLFRGESSFLDWREQTYPIWMDNVDISQSMNLGTNVVYYRTFEILAQMARELGDRNASAFFSSQASVVKENINKRLWNEDRGFYNQFLYGRHFMNVSERSEALGEALSILTGVADRERAQKIVKNTPVLNFGISCIYPQIPNIPPYHNNGIWPFVQAYWNWAAAKTGNPEALEQGLAAIYRPAAFFLTNKENFVAENGDFKGTQVNSDRQLWSVAGNLAMVYRVLLGMEFQPDKLVLDPTVPESWAGTRTIKGFRYRDAVLNIEVEGFGDGIATMTMDGEETGNFAILADLSGEHDIHIKMNNRFEQDGGINLVKNDFTLPAPRVEWKQDKLSWKPVEGAGRYVIFRNGEQLATRKKPSFKPGKKEQHGQFKVMAMGADGWESFTSEPLTHYRDADTKMVEIESLSGVKKSGRELIDYSGSGFVEITKEEHTELEIPVEVSEAGTYLATFRYANGTGPWNTDNNCAIRTLMANGKKAGTVVMAQRGEGEWANWGMTNRIEVKLKEGQNMLKIAWQPSNENMDGDINRAVLDRLELVKMNSK